MIIVIIEIILHFNRIIAFSNKHKSRECQIAYLI